jgi:hypothetical protein
LTYVWEVIRYMMNPGGEVRKAADDAAERGELGGAPEMHSGDPAPQRVP